MLSIARMTGALEASPGVDTRLRAVVFARLAFIDVLALSSVGVDDVPRRAGTYETAMSITTVEITRLRVKVTFVDVNALASRRVNTVAVAAETPVRSHCVDATAVWTGVWHQATLVKI